MSLPASIGLVSFGEAYDKAVSKEPRIDLGHIELDYEGSIPRYRRAADALVEGPVTGVWRPCSEMAILGYFRVDIIEATVAIRAFRPPAKRSANIDEIIAFIGKYPEIAKRHRIVCLNSGIFGIDEVHVRLIGFVYMKHEKTGREFFYASRIEQIDRVLLKGDLVLSKK